MSRAARILPTTSPSTNPATVTHRARTTPSRDTAGPVGSRLDTWWLTVMGSPARQRLWFWGGPAIVTVLAALVRLVGLGHPHSLAFDETYYVKDSYTLMNLGYEATWPDGADDDFNAGNTEIYTTKPSFVAHPQLGKWIMSLGIALFGIDSSVGWRIAVAVAGVAAVVLLMVIAQRLFGSTLLTTTAGLLFAIEGNAIVLSRVALLDNLLMLLTLAGFACVLADRGWLSTRLAVRVNSARLAGRDPDWGPVLWWRPWLLAAAVLFGMSMGVKWSGVYFLAVFGIYVVVSDALLRRGLGLHLWGSGAVLKQGPATFVLFVPVALVTYVVTWLGWILTSGGYDRDFVERTGRALTGAFSWLPHWLQNLWHYHASMYNYHVNVHAEHPYQSSPLSWLLAIRPTSMYYEKFQHGQGGCGANACSEAIVNIPNVLIWWAAALACFYLVYRLIRYRDWRLGLILTGMVAGYLPWMLYLTRTVFSFYTIAFEPYLILALAATLGVLVGRPTDPRWHRTRGLAYLAVFVGMALLISAFFLPIWTGIQVPTWFWRAHMWFPSWV